MDQQDAEKKMDIWVVLQHREGKLHRMSREAIGAGQKLAAELGGRVSAVLLGSDLTTLSEAAAGFALDKLYVVDDAALADYTPGAYSTALAPALEQHRPSIVILPHTYQTVDYLPRLAQQLQAALVPEAISYELQGAELIWKRPIMGGKLHAKVRVKSDGMMFVSVQSGAFPADAARPGAAPVESLTVRGVERDRELLGVEQVGGDQVDLSKADVIVAVGRGVGGADKLGPIEELAKVLGGDIGASRPVIDNGWLPRDRQIGSSGQTVAPKLYLALGISGAIQHLVGMKGAGCVVAINKDASAPIFTVAHYGIVGDLEEHVPALTAAIAEAKA